MSLCFLFWSLIEPAYWGNKSYHSIIPFYVQIFLEFPPKIFLRIAPDNPFGIALVITQRTSSRISTEIQSKTRTGILHPDFSINRSRIAPRFHQESVITFPMVPRGILAELHQEFIQELKLSPFQNSFGNISKDQNFQKIPLRAIVLRLLHWFLRNFMYWFV